MKRTWTHRLDRCLALPMFLVAMLSLVIIAGCLQTVRSPVTSIELLPYYLLAFASLYPPIWLEVLAHLVAGSRLRAGHGLACLLPPVRLATRDHSTGRTLWLPKLGWKRAGRDLQRRLEKITSRPMILFALAILPVLGVEFLYQNPLTRTPLVTLFLEVSTSLIWLAFATELIVMLSVVDKKFRYCREHWIDVVIVLLPLFAFLRLLRLARLLRLLRVTRLLRVYRLRGITSRALRAMLLLDAVQRLLWRNPRRRLRVLRERLEELELTAAEVRRDIRELEARLASSGSDEQIRIDPAEAASPGGRMRASAEERTPAGPASEA